MNPGLEILYSNSNCNESLLTTGICSVMMNLITTINMIVNIYIVAGIHIIRIVIIIIINIAYIAFCQERLCLREG